MDLFDFPVFFITIYLFRPLDISAFYYFLISFFKKFFQEKQIHY